ncbi:hypothetical protein [Thermaurantimonas aggregans]|nr:hypothetical protein [Thermaurantimonas aggregans]MCX8149104.1 hypothetical protein [Thermaurantimonas aggregans]
MMVVWACVRDSGGYEPQQEWSGGIQREAGWSERQTTQRDMPPTTARRI